MSKSLFTTLALSLALTVPVGVEAQRVNVTIEAPSAPPARRAETRPARPANAVWVAGHWERSRSRWVWSPGYWVMPRAGHVLVAPRWVRRGNRWVYQHGGWARAGTRRVVHRVSRAADRVERVDRRRDRRTNRRTTVRTRRR